MLRLRLTPSQSKLIDGVQNHTMGHCWAVGGAIRDLLLGHDPKDIDFVTDLKPEAVERLLKTLGFIVIPDQTALDHGIVRTVDKDTGDIIDIATLRRDTCCDGRHARVELTDDIKVDLQRRDLTINSLAAEIDKDGYLSDIIFGAESAMQDFIDKTIKFVSYPQSRIDEDKLRMLRACRFTALDKGWTINNYDRCFIEKNADKINKVSKERIRDEILKALSYSKPSNFIRTLNDCKLLKHVLLPVYNCIGIEQNLHHNETVYEHCLASVDASCELTDDILLRLAILLHDIGKPASCSTGSDGRTHFHRHEVEGASIAYNWMQEFKFSKKEIEYVTKLIRHHQWRFEDDTKEKTIRKWLQTIGKDWKDLITLRCADRRGNMAKQDKPMMTRHMKKLVQRAEEILRRHDAIFKEDLAINGHDLKELGIQPGPQYKEIFSNILGIVITNPEKNNRDWLLEFVKKNYVKE